MIIKFLTNIGTLLFSLVSSKFKKEDCCPTCIGEILQYDIYGPTKVWQKGERWTHRAHCTQCGKHFIRTLISYPGDPIKIGEWKECHKRMRRNTTQTLHSI